MGLFDFLAGPLGWIMKLVYNLVNNYFVAIFLFTLLVRVLMFPLSLQSQKKQADRIRLSPRLERLQKKYKDDPQKLQKKQQALYEKEGVSMTGGCLPMIVQMIVLFGIIAVIYKPLAYLSSVDKVAIDAAVEAVNVETYTAENGYTVDGNTAVGNGLTVNLSTKEKAKNLEENNYYREMYLMQKLENNREEIVYYIDKRMDGDRAVAEKQYNEILTIRKQFSFGEKTLLQNPWVKKDEANGGPSGFGAISILWLIPLLSGVTAILSTMLSMYYTKQGTNGEKQPGQGCSNTMMFLFMPLFSVYIAFTVPGGVGVYWICSNVIAILQTFVLNMIYNPKKIRAQAEIDYQERRKQRAAQKGKQTLAEARRLDDERERLEDEAAARAAEEAKNAPQDMKKKQQKRKKSPLELGEVKRDEE